MKTVYRVQLAPNLAFHVPEGSPLLDLAKLPTQSLGGGNFRYLIPVEEVPFCNNYAHEGAHTPGILCAGPDFTLTFPSDTSECYVESEDR